jgi:hypothetical protein
MLRNLGRAVFGLGRKRFCVAALLSAWLLATTAHASDTVRKDLADLATELDKFLRKQGESAIAVSQFEGPATFPNSAGPGIAMTLAEELGKRGIEVKLRARLGVRGQYRIAEDYADPADLTTKYLAVRLQASVVDAFNNVQKGFEFERVIARETALVELLGAVVELASNATPRQRDQMIRKSLIEPGGVIAEKKIAAAAASPYGVEILVDGQPRDARDDEGLPFVNLDRAEAYAIRLINNSDKEAAVRLSIDGLSLFAFSEHRKQAGPQKGEPLYSVLLIPAGKSLTIKGWHLTNESADPFKVTGYGKGPLALPKQTAKVGTITATFAAAWPEDNAPPADEAPAMRGTPHATETGPPSATDFDVLRRKVGTLRSVVSVRFAK